MVNKKRFYWKDMALRTALHLVAAGLAITATLGIMAGCQSTSVSSASVFGYEKRIIPETIPFIAAPTNQVLPEDFTYGVISSRENLRSFLEKVIYADQYQDVVILAGTDYSFKATGNGISVSGGAPAIFGYEDFGIIGQSSGQSQKIFPDSPLIKKLAAARMINSLGKVKVESYWAGEVLPLVQAKFVNAKLAPFSINRKITAEQASQFAYVLKTALPERSLVIALADFNKAYHDYEDPYLEAFTSTALTAADANKADELNSDDGAVLQVLADYLNSAGAKNAGEVKKTGQDWNALYLKGERKSNGKIYLTSFGDVMLGRQVRTRMNAAGMDYSFENMDPAYLKTNDLLLANLEGPVAKNAIKTSKAIAFRFMPDVVPLLKKYYFDVVSLANNHAYDMGAQGYKDSRELLLAGGILPFGDARELNGDSVAKLVVRGQKIAFLGLEEVVYRINDDAALKKVRELAAEGYWVIPYVHMGTEYVHKPVARQKDFYRKLIDAGAYMVIGHHPHVVEGYEKYNGRLIFYSLGNAIFDQDWSYDTQEGLSIAIEMGGMDGGNPKVRVWLMPIRIDKSSMRLMNEDERKVFFEKFAQWSDVTGQEKEQVLTGVISI